MKAVSPLVWTIVGAGTVLACSVTQPSAELVDARQAYLRAMESPAAQHEQDELLAAKQALQKAEEAYEGDPGSRSEKHLAYLAERRAQMAEQRGLTTAAEQDQMKTKAEYDALEKQMRKQTEQRLEKSREALGRTTSALAAVQAQLGQAGGKNAELEEKKRQLLAEKENLEKSLAVKGTELEAEREARIKAEKTAAAALASLDKFAQVKADDDETIITLNGSVLFETGKSKLLPAAEERLRAVARALKQQKNRTIQIAGHTDSRGATQMNEKLSLDRAKSVREFLVSHGVKPGMIEAVGRGEAQPVAENGTAEGRANNRRVEIIVRKGT